MPDTDSTTRVTADEEAARLLDAVRAVQGLCEGTDRDVPVAALRSVLTHALGDLATAGTETT